MNIDFPVVPITPLIRTTVVPISGVIGTTVVRIASVVLNSHKAVQCDKCEMWVQNNCSFMSDSEYETMQNSNCTWICPKCDFFNFSDSFFNEQFNLKSENGFYLLAKGHETKSTETLNSKNSFISGLKFSSININSIYTIHWCVQGTNFSPIRTPW